MRSFSISGILAFCCSTSLLALSSRALAYLARRGFQSPPTMAFTTYEEPKPEPEVFKEPPEVCVTPCDPWPRPYYIEKGLRRVAPYYYTYNTYCKERWRGKNLLDIYSTEFRDRPNGYYVCLSLLISF